jgi:hypothetical protein
MTEALPHTSTEQSTPSETTTQSIGSAAISGVHPETQHYDPEITIADLVDMRSHTIYEEYRSATGTADGIAANPEISRETIYNFVAKKARTLHQQLPDGSTYKEQTSLLEKDRVRDGIKKFTEAQGKSPRRKPRLQYRESELIKYKEQLDTYSTTYPEIAFARKLRQEFQRHSSINEAVLTDHVLIGMAHAIVTPKSADSVVESGSES